MSHDPSSSPARRLARAGALAGLFGLFGLLGLSAAAPAHATDVGVSIGISQPGVYGRIDIGRFPQPQVIVQRPVVIVRQAQLPPPVYLHVPPGHRKNWRAHCARYDACGQPVYFVQERWYQDHVARPAPRRGERWDDRRDVRRDDRRDGRWDERRGDGRGDGRDDGHPGRGNGHGKGQGRGHD